MWGPQFKNDVVVFSENTTDIPEKGIMKFYFRWCNLRKYLSNKRDDRQGAGPTEIQEVLPAYMFICVRHDAFAYIKCYLYLFYRMRTVYFSYSLISKSFLTLSE